MISAAIRTLISTKNNATLLRCITWESRQRTISIAPTRYANEKNDSNASETITDDQCFEKTKAVAKVLSIDHERLHERIGHCEQIIGRSKEDLVATAVMLVRHFQSVDLLSYPKVLGLPWQEIQDRQSVLAEIGTIRLKKMDNLLLFEQIGSMSIYELKEKKIIKHNLKLDHLIAKLHNCPGNLREKLHKLLPSSTLATLPLFDYRRHIIHAYIKETIGEMKFDDSRLKVLERQSLESVTFRIDLLLGELKLDKLMILSQRCLLLVHTHNLMGIVNEIKDLRGCPLKEVIQQYPRILSIPYENLLKTEQLFQECEIGLHQIRNLWRIYEIDPDDLTKRIEELENAEEFNPRMRSPSVIQYLIQIERVMKIAEKTPSREMKPQSLLNSGLRTLSNYASIVEIVAYLMWRLVKAKPDRTALRQCLLASPRRKGGVSLPSCKIICDYLLDQQGVTESQLSVSVDIVLFRLEEVQRIFENFPCHIYEKALGKDWRSHPLLIEFVLYEMQSSNYSKFEREQREIEYEADNESETFSSIA